MAKPSWKAAAKARQAEQQAQTAALEALQGQRERRNEQ
jgi:hypothetical protein